MAVATAAKHAFLLILMLYSPRKAHRAFLCETAAKSYIINRESTDKKIYILRSRALSHDIRLEELHQYNQYDSLATRLHTDSLFTLERLQTQHLWALHGVRCSNRVLAHKCRLRILGI